MTKNSPERLHLGIIGDEGKMGERLKKELTAGLEKFGFVITGFDRKSNNRTNDLETIIQQAEVVVLALPGDSIQTTYPEYIHQLQQESPVDARFVINMNSVQAPAEQAIQTAANNATTTIVTVNLHPYFGPKTPLERQPLIYSGIDIAGPELPAEQQHAMNNNWQQLLAELAKTTGMTLIDLSQQVLSNPDTNMELQGTQLHDYLAAYSQAPFHILRLKLFQLQTTQPEVVQHCLQAFSNVNWDLDNKVNSIGLSNSIVADNPFAQNLAKQLSEPFTLEGVHQFTQLVSQRITELTEQNPQFNFATNNVKALLQLS